MTVSDAISILI